MEADFSRGLPFLEEKLPARMVHGKAATLRPSRPGHGFDDWVVVDFWSMSFFKTIICHRGKRDSRKAGPYGVQNVSKSLGSL